MASLINGVLDTTYGAKEAVFPMPLETARTAAPARPKRRGDVAGRILDAGWAALLLSCAWECVSRLLWAVQP